LPIPSNALATDPIPEPFLGTPKEEDIHPLEFPFEFEEDYFPKVGNTLNHPIQQRPLASLTPNHHLLYSFQDLVAQEPLELTSSSTSGFDLPYDPPCFLVNNYWHFLASSLGIVFPSNDTGNALTIFLNTCRNIPQAHGYIIVAFHPVVFRYRSFIFSQRKAWYKSL